MNLKMTTKRFYFLMIGLNVLCFILIIAIVVWGNGLIKEQTEKLKTAKTENQVIEQQQLNLVQAKQDVEKYKELNETVKTIVPQDKDQARTIREINKIAEETGVKLKEIKFQTSNLGQITAPVKPPTEGEASSTPAAPAAPPLSQVTAVDGIKGVFALEIIISSQETQATRYEDFIEFLERLENNRRTAHVDKIYIQPVTDGSLINFTLTLNAYVKP